ncbi:hypothetical protein SISNIDRAFT_323464 [Sistotremastrum niveocremeum HHB9708]|uniref:Arrestin-like N-terminal domain-containing protein n=1 Tax=Sistotremastrum niveocremeum HHB9708 TaxID=1314777 RepID=A0A164MSF2_9AGAM|nr:hypothetical protein SISNIDRAFT_323464 [Sistotremastrum niveocremeum HHB9708]
MKSFRDPVPFLEDSKVIWTSGENTALLEDLSFSIILPTTCKATQGLQWGSDPLPSTFSGDRFAVSYALFLVASRRLFQSAITVQTPFRYVPLPIPPNPSLLILRSYAEGTPLPGPAVDDEGWFGVPAHEVTARLFLDANKLLKTKLYLAKPLMYSRTGYIPFRLTLQCLDSQIIDLLARPGIPRLCLVRRETLRPNSEPIRSDKNEKTVKLVGISKTWLAPKPENNEDNNLTFYGEIQLTSNLVPSFSVGELSVKYYVILLPWTAPGLTLSVTPNVPIIQQEVDIIATPLAPLPISSAPPEALDYAITLDQGVVGLLDRTGLFFDWTFQP